MSVMDPTLIINPAINLKGGIDLGQWNNPNTGYIIRGTLPALLTASVKGNGLYFGPQLRFPGARSASENDLGFLATAYNTTAQTG